MLLLEISRNEILVVACDSIGGVGPKERDSVKVPGAAVGKYGARTVLLEVACAGATVSAVTVSMAVELDPTGRHVLAGCQKSMAELGSKAPVIWSSEKNFAVDSTGIGLSAVGIAKSNAIKIGCSQRGDSVVLVGKPSVGNRVLEAEKAREVPSIRQVLRLMNLPFVNEVIPVGSTGVLHEANVMAGDSGLRFKPSENAPELELSAGPSTAVLVSLPSRAVERLPCSGLPANVIGSLETTSRRTSQG